MISLGVEIGNKFNRLTIKSIMVIKGRTYFACACDCGTLKAIKASHVKSGRTKSCGCYRRQVARNVNVGKVSLLLKPDNYSAKYRVYKSYEKHAKDRNLLFNLTFDKFVEISQQNCFYCDSEPLNKTSARQSRSSYTYNGIDRVDNALGYEEFNCVPCCKICNIAKSNRTKQEFLSWIIKVYSHNVVTNDCSKIG